MIVNKALKDFIYELDDVMQANILCAEFFDEHFYSWEPTTDIAYFESFFKEGLYRELILDLDGLNEEDIDEEFFNEYLLPSIKEFDENKYFNNPYLKNIKIPHVKSGKYQLNHLMYRPYELFPIDDIIVDKNTYKELSQIGYFKKEVSYPFLGDENNVWMSINPNEVLTMQKHIDASKGNVLVLGLGLGYFAYMISNKKDVNKVIVIENDNEIINLFKKHILPQFENKNKIEIIRSDAFKYLKDNDGYDMVFADIWHDANDGIMPFIKLKEIEGRKNIPFMYWIDNSLYAMVRRCIVTILVEHMENDNPRYDIAKDEMDKAINSIYLKIKDLKINTKEEIMSLISDENIDKLLRK